MCEKSDVIERKICALFDKYQIKTNESEMIRSLDANIYPIFVFDENYTQVHLPINCSIQNISTLTMKKRESKQ